ncbi:hypothetical protein AVEN_193684-1 [Araneus ventricosus]|uniref:IGFBP N-terminal domain-containing protein n=1 Tax=Araneus ventricosus TaxID=182803 RepID=A0A4Y2V3H5_ARAVE|nr:hypothetical protein AVEN_99884-1 [Araneus ventricosus]GBO19062.1 hypothetical protein AVEN_193684-1 [Araneus ventricosus]
MFKIVLLISAAIAIANAIVCTDDVCSRVRCMQAICTGKEVFVPKGGYCGCCDACVTYLSEGEECPVPVKGGGPPTRQCSEGLECVLA